VKKIIFILCSLLYFNICYAQETFIIACTPNYPPITWKTSNVIKGISVDLIKVISKELNIKFVHKESKAWEKTIHLLAINKADLIIGLYKTENRKAFINFSNEYILQEYTKIFVRKENKFKFEKWEDLYGKRMGSMIGDSKGEAFDIFMRRHLAVKYTLSREETFENLLSGRVDFICSSYFPILIQLKKMSYDKKIVPLINPVTSNNIYFGYSKKSKINKYKDEIDKILKKVKNTNFFLKSVQRNIKEYLKTGQ